MPSPDETPPRHRKPGRAQKRGRAIPGRRIRDGGPADCGCPPGYHEYGAHAPGAWPDADINPPPPGAYPVEDLAGMSTGAAALLLHRATLEAEAEAATCAHIVITRDVATGVVTSSGPFDTGLEALTSAHDFLERQRAADPARAFTLTVAPLFPH
ncbi:hypothetical protein EFK50_15780 [Nocardioides marmoriginsengisoli]|uniref:Uncharacterized protein n=1 Tax=Nocardioides marmoriginsengisoli TaxID=661483 RepID=A0A3N0CJP7_9ACTN|nr:hypothetical protein [Nocardioides marmoriginsengisoli]RNL63163.1 hypothetical protein EFK50_15780 [Nocardioides marmoriginsengisoli]